MCSKSLAYLNTFSQLFQHLTSAVQRSYLTMFTSKFMFPPHDLDSLQTIIGCSFARTSPFDLVSCKSGQYFFSNHAFDIPG